MTRRGLIVLWLVLVLTRVPLAVGQSAYPTRSDPFVNDYAELLTAGDASDVQALLSDLQTAHGIEAVVVTIGSIGDYATGDTTIEAFATGLFNAWGVGDATRNDGVLLLVAVKDRKVRVELGAGYGSGPSAEMQAVIDRYVLPKFRTSNYSAGIHLGVQAMIAKLTDQPMPEIGDVPPTRVPSASRGSGTTSTRTSSGSSAYGPLILLVVVGGFAIIGSILRGSNSGGWSSDQNDHDSDDDNHRSSWTSSHDSSSSSGSSSSSHSDRSSRGGGQSSGGGASGSW